jgi:hypothetical protein
VPSPARRSRPAAASYYPSRPIDEALASFAHVHADKLATHIQYDYLAAYPDFFTDNHAVARGIAEKYRDYPSPLAQLLPRSPLPTRRSRRHRPGDARSHAPPDRAAASEPRSRDLRRTHDHPSRKRRSLRAALLPLDVELAFSSHPFTEQNTTTSATSSPRATPISRSIPSSHHHVRSARRLPPAMSSQSAAPGFRRRKTGIPARSPSRRPIRQPKSRARPVSPSKGLRQSYARSLTITSTSTRTYTDLRAA